MYLKAKGTKRRQTLITRSKQLENIIVNRWLMTNSIQPQTLSKTTKIKIIFSQSRFFWICFKLCCHSNIPYSITLSHMISLSDSPSCHILLLKNKPFFSIQMAQSVSFVNKDHKRLNILTLFNNCLLRKYCSNFKVFFNQLNFGGN